MAGKRKIYVSRNHRWIEVPLREVKRGETFIWVEPDNSDSSEPLLALGDPFEKAPGIWAIKADPAPTPSQPFGPGYVTIDGNED